MEIRYVDELAFVTLSEVRLCDRRGSGRSSDRKTGVNDD